MVLVLVLYAVRTTVVRTQYWRSMQIQYEYEYSRDSVRVYTYWVQVVYAPLPSGVWTHQTAHLTIHTLGDCTCSCTVLVQYAIVVQVFVSYILYEYCTCLYNCTRIYEYIPYKYSTSTCTVRRTGTLRLLVRVLSTVRRNRLLVVYISTSTDIQYRK